MLTILGMLILVVAGIASAVYSIQILIMNFQENVLWGLASLFFGLPSLIFIVLRWDKAGPPFLKSLVAGLVSALGVGLMILGGGGGGT
jgi:hypothetical protein